MKNKEKKEIENIRRNIKGVPKSLQIMISKNEKERKKNAK